MIAKYNRHVLIRARHSCELNLTVGSWNVLGVSYETDKYDYSCRDTSTEQELYYSGQDQQPPVCISCRRIKLGCSYRGSWNCGQFRMHILAPFYNVISIIQLLASQQYLKGKDLDPDAANSWDKQEGWRKQRLTLMNQAKCEAADSSHCCLPH